jgi:competence protein ComEC
MGLKVFPFPLIPFVLALAAGIVAGKSFLPNGFQISIGIAISFLIFLLYFLKARRQLFPSINFGIATAVLAFFIGTGLHFLHFQPNRANHYSHLLKTENNYVTGTVSKILKSSAKNHKYEFEIQSVNQKQAIGKILIYNKKDNPTQLKPGDVVLFESQLQSVLKNLNPYQFDYANYLANQHIFHQVFLKPNDFKIIGNQSTFASFIHFTREKLTSSFHHLNWKPETQAFINALLFGQKNHLEQETLTSFTDAGVMHVLAISGLHVGIIYIFIAFALKPLKRYKKGRLIELLLTLFLLWSFAAITGFSASVSRAVTLFSIIAIGRFWNKRSSVYNSIAASALLLLLVNPNFIFDIGFQLSYSAVLSIVLFQPFFERFYFSKNKISRYVVDLILVSVAAQIGVLPLSLYYFNQFPILFLVANILVIPFVTLLLLLGVLTLILNFIFPMLAQFPAFAIEKIIDFMTFYVGWISKFDTFIIRNISFSASLCLVAYLMIACFLYWLYQKKNKALIYFLVSIILVQITYVFSQTSAQLQHEMLIFNTKGSLFAIKKNTETTFFSTSPEEQIATISDYNRGNFTENSTILPIENVYLFGNRKILVIDDSGYFKIGINPDVVVLIDNPKINLERVIKELQPKTIIADNSNSFYRINQWKATCEQEKIPFHATAEKGFYRIK